MQNIQIVNGAEFKHPYEQYLERDKKFCIEVLIGYKKGESEMDDSKDSYEAFIINRANLKTDIRDIPLLLVCYKIHSIRNFIDKQKSPGNILFYTTGETPTLYALIAEKNLVRGYYVGDDRPKINKIGQRMIIADDSTIKDTALPEEDSKNESEEMKVLTQLCVAHSQKIKSMQSPEYEQYNTQSSLIYEQYNSKNRALEPRPQNPPPTQQIRNKTSWFPSFFSRKNNTNSGVPVKTPNSQNTNYRKKHNTRSTGISAVQNGLGWFGGKSKKRKRKKRKSKKSRKY